MITTYRVEEYRDLMKMPPPNYVAGTSVISVEFSIWNRTNGTNRSWIYGSISSEVSSYLTGNKTAREL